VLRCEDDVKMKESAISGAIVVGEVRSRQQSSPMSDV
jgi:hypothetical protein